MNEVTGQMPSFFANPLLKSLFLLFLNVTAVCLVMCYIKSIFMFFIFGVVHRYPLKLPEDFTCA